MYNKCWESTSYCIAFPKTSLMVIFAAPLSLTVYTSDILDQHRKFSPVDNTILPGKRIRT